MKKPHLLVAQITTIRLQKNLMFLLRVDQCVSWVDCRSQHEPTEINSRFKVTVVRSKEEKPSLLLWWNKEIKRKGGGVSTLLSGCEQ